MDERVARLRTSKNARTLAKNAQERGQLDLASEALTRARELQAIEEGYRTPAEQAIATVLYAYEEHQSAMKGRASPARRTRKMFADHGTLKAVERLVMTRKPTVGYQVLEEAGLNELSFEAIVVKFPDEFSAQAVEFAQARLDNRPLPPLPKHALTVDDINDADVDEINHSTPIRWDAEAQSFLAGFMDPEIDHRTQWLPRYRDTTQEIARALSEGQLDLVFDTLWKTTDNNISKAGQGIVKFDTVDAMRDELIQVIRDIHDDHSPENFERIVERFEGWKNEGRTNKVPRLLIARAFAGIHPDRHHTTVDSDSQNEMLRWFGKHTGFVMPKRDNWAARAQSLVNYLDRSNVFGNDLYARNIFPWWVIDQLRDRHGTNTTRPDRTPRPYSTFAHLPAAERLIRYKHRRIQDVLLERLQGEFGERVYPEYPTGTGGLADLFVRHDDGRSYLYEIKIADSAAMVVREAMGQLLEYSFRHNGLQPEKLFAVGEHELDELTEQFLARLRVDFNLDIDYIRVELPEEPSPA